MISKNILNQIIEKSNNQIIHLPTELNLPNINIISELIYSNNIYTSCKTIEELDNKQYEQKIDLSYYNTIRPIIKCLFDLNKYEQERKFEQELELEQEFEQEFEQEQEFELEQVFNSDSTTTNILDTLKIFIDPNEMYEPVEANNTDNFGFKLNKSQIQVSDSYDKNGVVSGLICHATGTGKTNCIFLTITKSCANTTFILCHYKNILSQMFYKSNKDGSKTINYDLFRKLKMSNIFDIWLYDIYDLTNDNVRRKIMKNINKFKSIDTTNTTDTTDTTNTTTKKRIFLINPQFVISKINNSYKLLPTPNLIIHDECHTITGLYTFNFLLYFKQLGSVMVGLSATPVRYLKSLENYNLLKSIYSNDRQNQQINIISSYEYITAIINNDILNFEIYWFEAQLSAKSANNKINPFNINNLINAIINTCSISPNKKPLLWCGTIAHAKHIWEKFTTNEEIKKIFPTESSILLDHSGIEETKSTEIYAKFKSAENNCLMICADKYREGSDFEYLDCVGFADLVKKKSDLPFIQCIGRVLRKGYNKTVGYVIDHYDVSSNYETRAKEIVTKLINYYYEFFSYAKRSDTDNTDNTDTNNLEARSDNFNNAIAIYEDILCRYKFEKVDENGKKNIIMVKLNDDIAIKIHTGLSDINFEVINNEFKPMINEFIQKEYNLNLDETLLMEYMEFRKNNKEFFLIETKNEYNDRVNEFGLIPDPKIKYCTIWTNWYDYLGIDTSIYPQTIDEWKNLCLSNKISSYKEYIDKIKAKVLNLPLMPEEIYGSSYTNFDIILDMQKIDTKRR